MKLISHFQIASISLAALLAGSGCGLGSGHTRMLHQQPAPQDSGGQVDDNVIVDTTFDDGGGCDGCDGYDGYDDSQGDVATVDPPTDPGTYDDGWQDDSSGDGTGAEDGGDDYEDDYSDIEDYEF